MFNVYVTGISPEKADNLEEIKKNVDLVLGIPLPNLDQLLHSTGNAICIRKNIPEPKAIKIRDALVRLGLLSSYAPTHTSNPHELSLVPLEEEGDLFICPACAKQQPLDGKPEPKFCPFCAVYVKQYRNEQEKKQEYQEIRKRLLALSKTHSNYEQRKKLKEEEIKRRRQMEQQIAKELGLNPKKWQAVLFTVRQTHKRYWITASVVVIGLTGLAVYKYVPTSNTHPDLLISQMPDNPKLEIQEVTKTIIVPATTVIIQGALPTQYDIENTLPIFNVPGLMVPQGQTPAQTAMAQGHVNVLKFVRSLGINAGKPTVVSTKNLSVGQIKAEPEFIAANNRLFLETSYSELESDVEWEFFLKQKAKAYVKAGKLKSAYLLSQYQTNFSDHIDVISELLAEFNRLGRQDLIDSVGKKLNQQIQTQPLEQQAIYTAQLAANTQEANQQNHLFAEAEKLSAKVSDPLVQSRVFSAMAVQQKRAGHSSAATQNLVLAEEKLKTVPVGFAKFLGCLNLARDYIKLGFSINTELTLTEAEGLLTQLDSFQREQGLSQLLQVAYLSNNTALSDKYSNLLEASAYGSQASYQAIQTKLKENLATNVAKPLSAMVDPDYAAIATALSAFVETDGAAALSVAQLQLSKIELPESKALATSKVARYRYRFGDKKAALVLFDQALNAALKIKNAEHKDAALILLTMDCARVFLPDRAERITSLIHSKSLQSTMREMIKTTQTIQKTMDN